MDLGRGKIDAAIVTGGERIRPFNPFIFNQCMVGIIFFPYVDGIMFDTETWLLPVGGDGGHYASSQGGNP